MINMITWNVLFTIPIKAVQVCNQIDFPFLTSNSLIEGSSSIINTCSPMSQQKPYETMVVSCLRRETHTPSLSWYKNELISWLFSLQYWTIATISSLSQHFKKQKFYKHIHQAGNNIFHNFHLILTNKEHNSHALQK